MSRISFRVNSIELKDSALQKISSSNLIKLALIQKPSEKSDEYLLKNVKYLHSINHEFIIDDPFNKIEKLTLTLASATKKTTLATIFSHDNNSQKSKQKNKSIDYYIQGTRDNNEGYIDCEYYESLNSSIGYRNIELKELKKGISNNFRMELMTRGTVRLIGYVNLDIYIWDSPDKSNMQQKKIQTNNEPILFVDPGCPPVTTEQFVF